MDSDRFVLLVVFLMLGLSAAGRQPVSSADQEIVIFSLNVIAMENDQVQANQTVIIRNGKITAPGIVPVG